jgi:hypothetical protein
MAAMAGRLPIKRPVSLKAATVFSGDAVILVGLRVLLRPLFEFDRACA